MDIVVTRAATGHAGIIAEFNQRMALETENKQLATETITRGVRAMVQDSSLGFYLIAKIDDKVVGCLGITYEWSDWRNGRFWWIQSVYVDPEFRGGGVFSRLYQEVKELAGQDEQACGIRLYVERDNNRAYRTYVKLGMIETDYRLMEEEF